jgi:hypothetical protein
VLERLERAQKGNLPFAVSAKSVASRQYFSSPWDFLGKLTPLEDVRGWNSRA